jgi:tetratricopeptide (TPR) repeat protein
MKTTLYILTGLFLFFTVSCDRTKIFGEYQDKILAIAHSEETSQEKIDKLNNLLQDISKTDVIKNKKDRTKLIGVCLNSIGNQYEKQRDYNMALNYYNQAIESDSTNGPIYCNRGFIYMGLNQLAKAEEDFMHSIRLAPKHAVAYNNMGALGMNKNQNEKALEYLNKAIELDPDYLDAYSNRATVYCNLKQYNKSIADNDFILSKDPKHLRAYLERAIVYIETKDYNKALADLDVALEIDSVNPYVLYNKAVLYEKKDDYANALEYFIKTSEADPNGQVGTWARRRALSMVTK